MLRYLNYRGSVFKLKLEKIKEIVDTLGIFSKFSIFVLLSVIFAVFINGCASYPMIKDKWFMYNHLGKTEIEESENVGYVEFFTFDKIDAFNLGNDITRPWPIKLFVEEGNQREFLTDIKFCLLASEQDWNRYKVALKPGKYKFVVEIVNYVPREKTKEVIFPGNHMFSTSTVGMRMGGIVGGLFDLTEMAIRNSQEKGMRFVNVDMAIKELEVKKDCVTPVRLNFQTKQIVSLENQIYVVPFKFGSEVTEALPDLKESKNCINAIFSSNAGAILYGLDSVINASLSRGMPRNYNPAPTIRIKENEITNELIARLEELGTKDDNNEVIALRARQILNEMKSLKLGPLKGKVIEALKRIDNLFAQNETDFNQISEIGNYKVRVCKMDLTKPCSDPKNGFVEFHVSFPKEKTGYHYPKGEDDGSYSVTSVINLKTQYEDFCRTYSYLPALDVLRVEKLPGLYKFIIAAKDNKWEVNFEVKAGMIGFVELVPEIVGRGLSGDDYVISGIQVHSEYLPVNIDASTQSQVTALLTNSDPIIKNYAETYLGLIKKPQRKVAFNKEF